MRFAIADRPAGMIGSLSPASRVVLSVKCESSVRRLARKKSKGVSGELFTRSHDPLYSHGGGPLIWGNYSLDVCLKGRLPTSCSRSWHHIQSRSMRNELGSREGT